MRCKEKSLNWTHVAICILFSRFRRFLPPVTTDVFFSFFLQLYIRRIALIHESTIRREFFVVVCFRNCWRFCYTLLWFHVSFVCILEHCVKECPLGDTGMPLLSSYSRHADSVTAVTISI